MNIKIFKIYDNIKEKDFPNYIKIKGYNCLKFCKHNINKIIQIVGFEFEYKDKGKPDFFIYKNKKCFFFCEFKSKNNSLEYVQLEWFISHKKFPNALAIVCNNIKKYKLKSIKKGTKIEEDEEETEEEKEMWEEINKAHRIRNKITDEYCEKHHPKKMYRDKNGWWFGTIPKEVIILWGKASVSIFQHNQVK